MAAIQVVFFIECSQASYSFRLPLCVSKDTLLWPYLVIKGLRIWPLDLGSNSIWPASSVLG